MQQTDVAIIGGGIVGLATAYRLLERFPDRSVTILEKEREVAQHQTGHNSGVLHSGIYYRPGSLRAANCREGKLAMEDFCQRENIPFNRCGKVIVAVTNDEIPQLERIYERGLANEILCERIGPERLREIEPHVVGVQAIHVPEAGIVDYRQVAERLADRIKEKGGIIKMSAKVTGMFRHENRMVVQNEAGELHAKLVVNCGGLHSDRLAWLSGTHPEAQIVPFRGEYFELKPSAQHLCKD